MSGVTERSEGGEQLVLSIFSLYANYIVNKSIVAGNSCMNIPVGPRHGKKRVSKNSSESPECEKAPAISVNMVNLTVRAILSENAPHG